ncbi:unnamed protein product [Ectocarpus sp. 12 AP-2014]
MPAKKKNSAAHKARIIARKARSSPEPDIWNGCIASQLREDLQGKVSYIRINGEGPVEPVSDIETIAKMVKLLKKEGAAELFQQN